MAQPAQIFTPGDPANGYVVVDDSAAPSFPTLNAGAELGYDTTTPGAVAILSLDTDGSFQTEIFQTMFKVERVLLVQPQVFLIL